MPWRSLGTLPERRGVCFHFPLGGAEVQDGSVIQAAVFLLLILLPFALFSVTIARNWTWRKLTLYAVGYFGSLGALVGAAMGLRGWYLVSAIATCMLGTWMVMRLRARTFDK